MKGLPVMESLYSNHLVIAGKSHPYIIILATILLHKAGETP